MNAARETLLGSLLSAKLVVAALALSSDASVHADAKACVGAYYFEGWYHDRPGAFAAFATEELRTHFPDRRATYMNEYWRDDSVGAMEAQIDLAADHGVQFFTFDWYWYGSAAATRGDGINGGLERFLVAANSHRMRFSIDVINVSPTAIAAHEWRAAVDLLMTYLAHPRYLSVGDKPLLTIFDPGDANIPFSYIEDEARRVGLAGVSLAADNRGSKSRFDHVVLYNSIPGYGAGERAMPYRNLTYYTDGVRPRPGETWADPGVWNLQSSGVVPGRQSFIPTVMSGFDARPWNTPDSWYFNNESFWVEGRNWGRTPENFAGHLRAAINWIDDHPDQATPERLVMIYAWNEFGEGGYIAPTVGDPDGLYLDAVRSVLGLPDTPEFRRADCNDDGRVDVSDPVFTVRSLFLGGREHTCRDSCDSNDDGIVDISDAIATLTALFDRGAIPAPGAEDCGEDPSDDELDCTGDGCG